MYYSPNPATQATLDSINRSVHKAMAGQPLHEKIRLENLRQIMVRPFSGEDRIRTCGTRQANEAPQ